MTFPESSKMLAGRAGVTIETKALSPGQKRVLEERESLFRLNKKILDFYRDELLVKPSGKSARDYLSNRKISEKTLNEFALGFVPDRWDSLVKFFRKIGVSKRIAEKSGLVLPGKNGHYYDRFRNRIIFPIFDMTSQIIGFGGRVMDDSLPKYLNSPETLLYNKSRSLYGLNRAKTAARQSGIVYIVEGYFDCISLSQHGFENVVATLGTSLTSDHVRMLKGHAGTMVLVYDSDAAGIKAAMRSIDVFMKESVDAKVLILPEGTDPDSFINSAGKDAFAEKAADALPMIPFLIHQSVLRNGLSIEGKLKILEDMKDPLSAVSDPVARSLYIKDISEKIGIDEPAVREKINEFRIKKTEQDRRKNTMRAGAGKQVNEITARKPDKIESQLISMMLQCPEILPHVKEKKIINLFRDRELQKIGNLILLKIDELHGDVADVIAAADANQVEIIAPLAISESEYEIKRCFVLLSQFIAIRQKDAARNISNDIMAAEKSNNQELLFELLKKKNQEQSKMLNIKY